MSSLDYTVQKLTSILGAKSVFKLEEVPERYDEPFIIIVDSVSEKVRSTVQYVSAHNLRVAFVGTIQDTSFEELSQYFNTVTVENGCWVSLHLEVPQPKPLPSTDEYLDIYYNYRLDNPEIYILTVKDNPKAEMQLQGCIKSIQDLGLNYTLFYGYDGTQGSTIKTPEHLQSATHMRWIKVLDPQLTTPEIACALGHIALWAHCISINKPIIILEHDAVMLRPLPDLSNVSSLEYLGHRDNFLRMQASYGARNLEQAQHVYKRSLAYKTRKHEQSDLQLVNKNFGFSRGLHAYAISPIMAKKLWSYVLENGVSNPADVIPRIGLFSIAKTGVFGIQAHNADHVSTIANIVHPASLQLSRKPTQHIPGIYN